MNCERLLPEVCQGTVINLWAWLYYPDPTGTPKNFRLAVAAEAEPIIAAGDVAVLVI